MKPRSISPSDNQAYIQGSAIGTQWVICPGCSGQVAELGTPEFRNGCGCENGWIEIPLSRAQAEAECLRLYRVTPYAEQWDDDFQYVVGILKQI